jgi:hypothetical protein
LISIISWTAFWINPSTAFAGQMSLGITSILAAITFNLTITNSLPRVPYATMMDVFIATCYLFFFSAILAVVHIHVLINRPEPERAMKLIHKFRWIFPALFVIAQVTALTLFLLA